MAASVWFVVALAAAVGGAVLLWRSRPRPPARHRERRRWARERGWSYTDSDPALPGRWRWGTVHAGGPGLARGASCGAVPGPDGRRLGHVFDHEQAGEVTAVVAAVRGVRTVPVPVELRLPAARPPDEAGLTAYGPVGRRCGYVAAPTGSPDPGGPRPAISEDLADAVDDLGDDVPLVWIEDTWVLAALGTDADAPRVERLLIALVAVSAAVDRAVADAAAVDRTVADGADGAPPDGAPPDGAAGDDEERPAAAG